MVKLNTSTPSGFPEFSPAQQRVIQHWKKTITEIFEANGFPILETPLVERAENFEAKGGNAKEIYILDRLQRVGATDDDKTVRAIRFDHTVPLALYVARHFNELAFPFRRSVIGPVMRGERAQKGRFRQFDQCDIDVIGVEKLSLANDAQMVAIIAQIFEKLMPEQQFVIRINNRKILTGFFAAFNTDPTEFKKLLEFLDNLEKNPNAKLEGHSIEFQERILEFVETTGSAEEVLEKLEKFSDNEVYREGISELREVVDFLKTLGVKKEQFMIDLRIARGLDYYTGTVYETNLVGYEKLGSVCSGGRYDDLASLFTGKKLPGVGISIGLTRLLWQLFEAKLVDVSRVNNSKVIILSRNTELIKESIKLGSILQKQGIATEIYMEKKKIQKQFDYAKKMGIPCRIIVGEEDTVVECDDLELKAQIENLI
jgi:histidyl-tRNA synthetase